MKMFDNLSSKSIQKATKSTQKMNNSWRADKKSKKLRADAARVSASGVASTVAPPGLAALYLPPQNGFCGHSACSCWSTVVCYPTRAPCSFSLRRSALTSSRENLLPFPQSTGSASVLQPSFSTVALGRKIRPAGDATPMSAQIFSDSFSRRAYIFFATVPK